MSHETHPKRFGTFEKRAPVPNFLGYPVETEGIITYSNLPLGRFSLLMSCKNRVMSPSLGVWFPRV